jgi:hypothetical protein
MSAQLFPQLIQVSRERMNSRIEFMNSRTKFIYCQMDILAATPLGRGCTCFGCVAAVRNPPTETASANTQTILYAIIFQQSLEQSQQTQHRLCSQTSTSKFSLHDLGCMWWSIAYIVLQIAARLRSCASQEDVARHLKANREHGPAYVDRLHQIIPGLVRSSICNTLHSDLTLTV